MGRRASATGPVNHRSLPVSPAVGQAFAIVVEGNSEESHPEGGQRRLLRSEEAPHALSRHTGKRTLVSLERHLFVECLGRLRGHNSGAK